MPDFFIYLLIFSLGGLGYGNIELIFRQKTHWTMVILGGICFLIMYVIDTKSNFKFWQKAVAGAAVITALEFCTGCIVNIIFKMNIWNYSDLPLNLFGQISLPFFFLWLIASALSAAISVLLYKYLSRK